MKDKGLVLGYMVLAAGLVRMYFYSAVFRQQVDGWNEYLEGAVIVAPWYYCSPISILDFFGSAMCCYKYRQVVDGRKSWFEVLIACTLMQFGGTSLTAIVLGQAPSWLMSKSAFPALILAWWLTFYCPGDVYWKTIKDNSLALFVIGGFGAISSAHSVGSWGIDKAYYNSFHANASDISKAYFVCILCGALSASGGGILCDALGLLSTSKSFTPSYTPSMFLIDRFEASATLNKAFLFACVYYCLITQSVDLPFGLQHVDKTSAHSILALAHIALYLQATHLPHIDVCQGISSAALRVLQVHPVIDVGKVTSNKDD
jgi:hypothetical protein